MMRCNQDGAHRPPVHHALWTLPSRSSPVERDLAACLRMLRPPDAAVGAMTCTVQATAKQRDAAESPERALRRAHARQRLGRRSRIQRSCSRTAGSHRLPDGTGWPARCTRTASRRRRRRSAWLLRRPTWRSCGPHGFDPGRQDPRGTLLRRFVITNPASGRTDVRWSIRRPTSRTTGRRSTARCIASPSPRAVWSPTPPPTSRASRPRARAVAKRCAASNATSPAASGVCCSHTPTSAHPLPHRRPRSPSTATSPTAASP